MKIFFSILLVSVSLLFVNGCCNQRKCTLKILDNAAVQEARSAIQNGVTKCALVQNGNIVADYSGRGVSPLLELYKSNGEAMENGIVVDKVIGRAAAFIVINGKASGVYALLLSEDAKELLEKHHITVEYDELVPKILNYNRDGLCPLEESVLDEKDPKNALEKLEAKIASFNK